MDKLNLSGIEIIDAPEVKSLSRKIADYSVTAIMWVLWLYLLVPLINLILWGLGIHYFYNTVFATTTASDIMAMMSTAGWTILGVFVVLRIWGLYNYWAFGKHDRRKAKDMSTIYGLARFHRIPPSRILSMQERREVVWPMYRTLHPDRDVEDWLEGRSGSGGNVTPIALQASSDYAGATHDIELELPMRCDDARPERRSN